MTTSVSVSPIGILGLGFLGKIIASDFADIQESWGTWNKNPPPLSALKVLQFDWRNETSWTTLPELPETIVLTIPPLLNDSEAEKVKVYDKGIKYSQRKDQQYLKSLKYRTGDIYIPKLDDCEPLQKETHRGRHQKELQTYHKTQCRI